MSPFPVPSVAGARAGTHGGAFDVDLEVGPSKSLHQRALVLAVLSARGATTRVAATGPVADDVVLLARALSTLAGLEVPPVGDVPGGIGHDGALGASRDRARCDLGMNATGLRLLTAVAGLRPRGARTLLTGAPRLRARPHRPLLRALARLGAHARRRSTGAIRVVATPWSRHEVAVASESSSQPVTALALAAPRAGGVRVRLAGAPVSRGYLALTAESLAAFGIRCRRDATTIEVAAGVPRCDRVGIEPDASSAAVWWAAAAMTGGRARVGGLLATSSQPDLALLEILERMGAPSAADGDGVPVVVGPDRLAGAGVVDLRDAPDLAPLVGALAAGAAGETRVVHAAHLAHKESDRIATVVAAIRAVGGDAEAAEDGFVVRGRELVGGPVRVRGDHRLALAFGALGLAVPGVVLDDVGAASKSYPGFAQALERASRGERGAGGSGT